MRRAVLIYNPASGGAGAQRAAQIEAALSALREGGVEAEAQPTRGPNTAGEQAQQAISAGADTILACGGDGTVNEVLQGVAGTDAALGVIPLGTANALAADLRIPRDPAEAAVWAFHATPQAVAAGRISFASPDGTRSRYFIVTGGIGADAHLMYALPASFKRKYGMGAYYAQALWIWATKPFVKFRAEFREAATGTLRSEEVTQVLAVRISEFGGVLRHLAPGAALIRDDFRLVLFTTTNRAHYLGYVLRCMLDRPWSIPGVELVDAHEVVCSPANGDEGRRVHVEADGELLGTLPTTLSAVPAAVKLLMK